jgi:hypothetical protein
MPKNKIKFLECEPFFVLQKVLDLLTETRNPGLNLIVAGTPKEYGILQKERKHRFIAKVNCTRAGWKLETGRDKEV